MPAVEPVLIEDYYELLALHNMLMVAKFETDIDDEFIGSPLIAAVQRRVADAALEAADPGPGWTRWHDAQGHGHRMTRVRAHLARSLQAVDQDRRPAFVRDVLAPLRPTEELVERLIMEAASDPDAVREPYSPRTL